MAPENASCPVCGATYTAKDANGDINPADVSAAVAAYNSAVEDACSGITAKLTAARPTVAEALVVKTMDLGSNIDDICTQLSNISGTLVGLYDDLPGLAQAKHDELQAGYNDQAKASAAACAASHKIEEESEG